MHPFTCRVPSCQHAGCSISARPIVLTSSEFAAACAVPVVPAFNPYPRPVQVGEFEVATGGGFWVAVGVRARGMEPDRHRTRCVHAASGDWL